MVAEWYYTEQGQRRGPVTWDQLRQQASGGQLRPTDLDGECERSELGIEPIVHVAQHGVELTGLFGPIGKAMKSGGHDPSELAIHACPRVLGIGVRPRIEQKIAEAVKRERECGPHLDRGCAHRARHPLDDFTLEGI